MQQKQVKAMRRKAEAAENYAPRMRPPLVFRVELRGESIGGMAVVCHPEDWKRSRTLRAEVGKKGS